MGEGDEEVVDKTGAPVFDPESSALVFFDLHLRENETAAAEFRMLVALVRPAAIEPPIPLREDQNIGEPELGARA